MTTTTKTNMAEKMLALEQGHVAFHRARLDLLRLHEALKTTPEIDASPVLAALTILQEVDLQVVTRYGELALARGAEGGI